MVLFNWYTGAKTTAINVEFICHYLVESFVDSDTQLLSTEFQVNIRLGFLFIACLIMVKAHINSTTIPLTT